MSVLLKADQLILMQSQDCKPLPVTCLLCIWRGWGGGGGGQCLCLKTGKGRELEEAQVANNLQVMITQVGAKCGLEVHPP